MPDTSTSKTKRMALNQVGDDFIASCLDWWQRDGALIDSSDDRMMELSGHLQLASRTDDIWPPPFLHIGPKSLATILDGHARRLAAVGTFAINDTRFAQNLQNGYKEADWTGKPVLDRVSGKYQSADRQAHYVCYDRLLLPTKTKSGKPMYAVCSALRSMLKVVD